MQDSTNDCGFAPINIEARGQYNQIWASLQRHESWHRRAHAELARFIIARRQYTAPLARATHAHGFPAQRGAIAHFDRRIKAIHVEMNDCSRLLFILHTEVSHNSTRG